MAFRVTSSSSKASKSHAIALWIVPGVGIEVPESLPLDSLAAGYRRKEEY